MEKVKGYIEHFLYKNAENGYGVLNLVTADTEIICTGSFRDVDVGMVPVLLKSKNVDLVFCID